MDYVPNYSAASGAANISRLDGQYGACAWPSENQALDPVSHFLIYQSPACFTDLDQGATADRGRRGRLQSAGRGEVQREVGGRNVRGVQREHRGGARNGRRDGGGDRRCREGRGRAAQQLRARRRHDDQQRRRHDAACDPRQGWWRRHQRQLRQRPSARVRFFTVFHCFFIVFHCFFTVFYCMFHLFYCLSLTGHLQRSTAQGMHRRSAGRNTPRWRCSAGQRSNELHYKCSLFLLKMQR